LWLLIGPASREVQASNIEWIVAKAQKADPLCSAKKFTRGSRRSFSFFVVQPYASGRGLHIPGVFHLVRTIHLKASLRIRPLAELAINMNDRNLRERLCAFIARFPVQIYQRIQKIVLKRTIVIES
jgi:hypothetical protein